MTKARTGLFIVGALCLIAGTTVNAASINRCVVGDKVIYSDQPCPSGATSSALSVQAPAPRDSEADRLQNESNLGHLAVGQTARQVELAWGAPRSKNIDTGTSGRREQWVYERPGGTTYVYIVDGHLSSVSLHEESGGHKYVPEVPVAPTQAELEAADREAKSGERRFVGKGISKAGIVTTIGAPDSVSLVNGNECWSYTATPQDQQTNTRICFDDRGRAVDVRRDVVPR